MSDSTRSLKLLPGLGHIASVGLSLSGANLASATVIDASPTPDVPQFNQINPKGVQGDTAHLKLAVSPPERSPSAALPPTFVNTLPSPRTAKDLGIVAETIDQDPQYFLGRVVRSEAQLPAIASEPNFDRPQAQSPSTPPPQPPVTPVLDTPVSNDDPELGRLKVQSALDPELGNLRVETAQQDELGRFRTERIPGGPAALPMPPVPPVPPAPKQPSVYLQGRMDYFKSDNVFSSFDTKADGLIRSGLTLFYAPALGKKTYLITSIDANLIRYSNVSRLNYNEVRLRAGIWQQLSPTMFGEIGWSGQQLYTAKEGLQDALKGDRFFKDNSLRLELSRADKLAPKVTLSTFYQLRMSFASPNQDELNDPLNRSRLINTFVGSLNYNLSPSTVVALDYQYAWSHYTQQARDDHYHQVIARFTYTMTPATQFNLFGGYSFGASTEPLINYNSFIFGVGLSFNLPLF